MESVLESHVVQLIIDYFIPVVATNILVDYIKDIVPPERRKHHVPLLCIVCSIVIGVVYSIAEYKDNRSLFLHVCYIFTLSNLIYSLGIYDFVQEKVKKLMGGGHHDEHK